MNIGKNFVQIRDAIAVRFRAGSDAPSASVTFPTVTVQPDGVYAGACLYFAGWGLFVGTKKTDELFAILDAVEGDLRDWRRRRSGSNIEQADPEDPKPDDWTECFHCGAMLERYEPKLGGGKASIRCPYCRAENVVDADGRNVTARERDQGKGGDHAET